LTSRTSNLTLYHVKFDATNVKFDATDVMDDPLDVKFDVLGSFQKTSATFGSKR
jgi:hypothetical protein